MRNLRRSPRSPSPRAEVCLRGVVPLDLSALGEDVSGGVHVAPDSLVPSALHDIEVHDQGLLIAPSVCAGREIPSLVPWSELRGVSADRWTALPDGTDGQVLEFEGVDGGWVGAGSVQAFVVPALEVGPFLSAFAAGRQADHGAASGDPVVLASAARSRYAAVREWVRAWYPVDGGPRHGQDRRRIGPVVVGLLAVLLVVGSSSASFVAPAGGALDHPPVSHPPEQGNVVQASAHPSANLPVATSPSAPAPPSLAGSPPLQSHEIFGYAPYWTLPQSSGFDVKDLTTLAYFSVDANADGTIDQSGPGWNGYQSQDLVNLVTRSHAAGDRVVLTVTCFSQSSLDAITSDPNAPARLSAALISLVSAKNLDGVNFDFEGQGSADRNGLTSLITQVSQALKAANPHWQVTMATYASAAGDSGGFYNVAALAPAVDGFFVMGYDMNNRAVPSATAPLLGGSFNDTEALQQFAAAVPPSKIILGVPYYGYDWPTTGGTKAAQATGGESPLSDGVIAASGDPTYWDPTTQTAWTSYQVGTQWHETFFDDPTALALKAQLAASFHIAGLGIWALGMDGNNPAMLAALLGNAPAAKDYQSGPTTGPSTGPPGTGFRTVSTWQGTSVSLTPIATPTPGGTAQYLGTLDPIGTTDPALACLQNGPPLDVWSFSTMPGIDIAVATQPPDCAAAVWSFPTPAASVPGGPGASATTTTTTTTTAPPPSTSTTTAPPPTTTTSTTTSTSTTTTVAPGGP